MHDCFRSAIEIRLISHSQSRIAIVTVGGYVFDWKCFGVSSEIRPRKEKETMINRSALKADFCLQECLY